MSFAVSDQRINQGRKVPQVGAGSVRHEEFLQVLEEGRLEEVVVESIRESEAFNDQAYHAAKPKARKVTLTATDKPN